MEEMDHGSFLIPKWQLWTDVSLRLCHGEDRAMHRATRVDFITDRSQGHQCPINYDLGSFPMSSRLISRAVPKKSYRSVLKKSATALSLDMPSVMKLISDLEALVQHVFPIISQNKSSLKRSSTFFWRLLCFHIIISYFSQVYQFLSFPF